MTPSECLTSAAALLTPAGAWCQGSEEGQTLSYARGSDGETVRLFRGMADKATFNPDVRSMTAYAAIVKVLQPENVVLEQPNLMWETLQGLAKSRMTGRVGGLNHLHPLDNYNEQPGQTAANVVLLLNDAAALCTQTQVSSTLHAAPQMEEGERSQGLKHAFEGVGDMGQFREKGGESNAVSNDSGLHSPRHMGPEIAEKGPEFSEVPGVISESKGVPSKSNKGGRRRSNAARKSAPRVSNKRKR